VSKKRRGNARIAHGSSKRTRFISKGAVSLSSARLWFVLKTRNDTGHGATQGPYDRTYQEVRKT
jgi:hypothetical protein